MLTNNYYNWRKALDTFVFSSVAHIESTNSGIIDKSGNSMEIVLCEGSNSTFFRMFDNKSLMKNIYPAIGSGNSESKKTDYCLESPYSVSDATYNRLVVYSSENGYKVSMTINGTNETNADVTIQEVGVFKTLYYANSSSTKDTLILRHVLQTPIVLRANEPFSINVEWIEQ